MNGVDRTQPDTQPYSLHCPQCRGSMRVAVEHVNRPVACPHCGHALLPWQILQRSPAPPTSAQAARMYGPDPNQSGMVSWRNRWVAGTLGVLLGGFGVHRFYLGFTGIGIVQILVTVFTFGIVGSIWGFIEGILCFCGAMRDVDGLELRS